jgi:hypothetical protein
VEEFLVAWKSGRWQCYSCRHFCPPLLPLLRLAGAGRRDEQHSLDAHAMMMSAVNISRKGNHFSMFYF